MKLNPVKAHREKKEAEKRKKEEEAQQKAAEARKKKKRNNKILISVMAAFAIIIAIGCFNSGAEQEPTETENHISAEAVVENTVTPDDTVEPSVEPTVEPTDEPTIEPTVEPSTEPEVETQAEPETNSAVELTQIAVTPTVDLSSIPAFSGEPYVVINNNEPYFSDSDLTTTSFETYSDLDSLGRCGVAYASIGTDLMPTEERGSIGQVKPTGWHTVKYDIVDGKYLYNRCHLIGYQLTAENANTKNLITGTRYLNVDGMLPFENMVADYIKETGNHVLYRVTPIFDGNNLLASGVLMEAESVEDKGDGILFNVYCYNAQPGVSIDYATGDSALDGTVVSEEESSQSSQNQSQEQAQTQETTPAVTEPVSSGTTYILNTNTKKFHYPSCSSVGQMKESNKKEYTGTRDEVIAMGYDPCGRCKP